MAANIEESRLMQLLQQTEAAQSQQQPEKAAQLLLEAQKIAPEHPLVLNLAGRHMLLFAGAEAAETLFRKAIAADGRNPSFWVNLASAMRRQKKPAEEEAALNEALKIQPRHLLALLQKGSLYESLNRPRAAARTFYNALQTVPPNARLPDFLRPWIDHASEVVQANDKALDEHLGRKLAAVRSAHAGADQGRFDHTLDAFFGRRPIYVPQPTFLNVPKVPAHEFYPREKFPWLAQLEAATDDITAEVQSVLAADAQELNPYIRYSESLPLDQWKELNHSRRWSAYFLWQNGSAVSAHLERCPRTRAVLEQLPMLDIEGYAPAAFFSVLDAKTRIPPHTGVTNARLIVHLPLVIPPGCTFRVGSETREWKRGEAWVFDDTLEHEAWNGSDVPRAILIFDIWNPYLTPAERDLFRGAFPAFKEFYGDEFEVVTG